MFLVNGEIVLNTTPTDIKPFMDKKKGKRCIFVAEIEKYFVSGWLDGFAVHIVSEKIKGYELPLSDGKCVKISSKANDYYGKNASLPLCLVYVENRFIKYRQILFISAVFA